MAGCIFAGAALAASPEEVASLGGERYTPMGAERPGNAAGTIPAWTGGITVPPADYRPGTWHPDPFADDEPLYTITAADVPRFADVLTAGQKALFETYPDSFAMTVYPSRRSASYPDWVYEGVRTNAANAELVTEGKGGVRNARITSPFPFPRAVSRSSGITTCAGVACTSIFRTVRQPSRVGAATDSSCRSSNLVSPMRRVR